MTVRIWYQIYIVKFVDLWMNSFLNVIIIIWWRIRSTNIDFVTQLIHDIKIWRIKS